MSSENQNMCIEWHGEKATAFQHKTLYVYNVCKVNSRLMLVIQFVKHILPSCGLIQHQFS